MQPAEPVLSNYPEGAAGEEWDEETLRNNAVSTCLNAWGLVYSQLFDGLEVKEAQDGSGRVSTH